MSKPKIKTSWEKRFRKDLIEFEENHQFGAMPQLEFDFITKWLAQELKREREEMGKALRMKEKPFKTPAGLIWGYNKAVKELNQKIDNYLKEKEG